MAASIGVLLVDDDPDFAEVTARFLERIDDEIETTVVHHPEDALDRLAIAAGGGPTGGGAAKGRFEPADGGCEATDGERGAGDRNGDATGADPPVHCVVSDYDMPDMDGLSLLRSVRERDDSLPFILFTGKGSEEIASEVISAGVTDYLQKKGTTDQYRLLANRIEQAVSRAEAEAALRRSEAEYRSMVESAPVPVVVYDRSGEIRFANRAAADFTGVEDPPALVGRTVSEFVHPDDRERAAKRVEQIFTELEPLDRVEYAMIDDTGGRKHAIVAGAPIHFDGERCGQAVLNDITKQTERERQFRDIAAASYDVIFRVDASGRFTYLSPAVERILQYEASELEGEHVQRVLTEDAVEEANAGFQRAVDGEAVEDLILTVERGDGTEGTISINAVPVGDDEVRAVQGVARDVTDLRERERELERQNERLQQFTSVVSHDLRNPLDVASSSAELLADECDSDHLPRLRRSLDRMETLVDELLTLAQQGEAVGDTEAVSLRRLAESCWQTVETGDATLEIATEVTVRADEHRLHELLANLVANAVTHGRPESSDAVTVTVGATAVGFYVADDGVGISPDRRDRIFEPGYSDHPQGTGFGLSIVEEVAEAHGWTVEVGESEDGGARFDFGGVTVAAEHAERR
jgi:PAS domain S-box-containing protein